MDCPFCTATLPDDDVFCEACGKPLHQPDHTTAAETGCTCGAPAEEIDADGYCGRCGLLARRPPTDHMELVLSPDFAGVTDRGLKHQRNEDRFALRHVVTDERAGDIAVVCDGVSSSIQSELAAAIVAEHVAGCLEASLRRQSASSPERTMRTAILDAQSRLVATGDDSPSTTIVAALVTAGEAIIGWVGDSRAYWIGADGETRQLTTDHSWINDVVSSGEMSAEDAAKAPQAHGITRWLGADAGENAQPDIIHVPLAAAGHLVLCTDGLWNYTPEFHLDPAEDLLEAARSLVAFANQQGGHDNITIVLRRVPGTTPDTQTDA